MQPITTVDLFVQAIMVAGITALVTAIVTAYISSKVVEAKLADLTERTMRIERYLNGLLAASDKSLDRAIEPRP